MTQFFDGPDKESDRRDLVDEGKRKGGVDWANKYWRPKPDVENVIRILPARKGSGAKYHLRAGKHFILHPGEEKYEAFVCNKETYGKPCPACDHSEKLLADGKTEESKRFKARRVGVFQIVDRSNESAGVKLYESPVKAVWNFIVSTVTSNGRMSNLFDEHNDKGELVKPGRDIGLVFDPKKHPSYMYKVFPLDQTPLGSEAQVKAWLADMIDLKPEILYPETDPDVVTIKTFGTKEERDSLREAMKENRGSESSVVRSRVDSEAPRTAAVVEEGVPAAESVANKSAAKPAVAEAPPPAAKPELAFEKPEVKAAVPSAAASATDTISKVRERIEAIKARAAAKK